MNRAELWEAAAPPCRECGEPIQHVEHSWTMQDGCWQLSEAVAVCTAGHRVLVEAVE